MDKGKRPIQEEENLSSPLDDYHTNNMILPPTPLAPPGFSVLNFEGSGDRKIWNPSQTSYKLI